jgi:peptide/nickel transport system permease protein
MMIHHAFKRGGFSNGMWYWYLPPGLCIGLCVFGFTLIGLYFEQSHKKETPGLLIE